MLKYDGTFENLVKELASLGGQWDESQIGKKVLRVGGGILNWWPTTGTLQFQGSDNGKAELAELVSALLGERMCINGKVDTDNTSPAFESEPSVEIALESELSAEPVAEPITERPGGREPHRMTVLEMTSYVIDMVQGRIFSSSHIPADQHDMILSVFIPLALGATSGMDTSKIGDVWEYLNRANGFVNGMPSFSSCRIVHAEDMKLMEPIIMSYRQCMKDAMHRVHNDIANSLLHQVENSEVSCRV